jgi:AraC-like DNA-binding protein
MSRSKRLYERAAAAMGGLAPLWHVDHGLAFFAGPLHFNASHQHSVPVYIAGLYAPFGLRISDGRWQCCHAAVIPAATSYALDVGGNPLAVLYLEPNVAGADALMPLLRNTREVDGAVIGASGETLLMRELYEARSASKWAGAAMDDLLRFSEKRSTRTLDPRVRRVVEEMHVRYDDRQPVAEVARSVDLSPSRFQHVFAAQVGVPFRRYRAWHRLRAAIGEIVRGSNFTTAAHAVGFADQAHFSHDFRRTFGATASQGLARVRL